MKLIFYGRDAQPAVPPSTALLSIDRKGVFSFTNGAVEALGLTPASPLVLAQDADTNTWYCVLEPVPGHESFILKPRDKSSSKALVFHSQPRGRDYWEAHGLNGQKSVRTLVSATPVEADGLKLYPLAPQHPTITPAAPVDSEAPAAGVEELSWKRPAPITALQPEAEAVAPTAIVAPIEKPAQADAALVASPAPIVGESTEERMERLTDHWYNLEIRLCPQQELEELQSLLADKPKKERDIVENTMLNRCKTELERRKKKGGARG